MATLDAVLATIDKNIDASTQRLFDLLRIPSVSTDPAYTKECERAADWLVRELQGLGLSRRIAADSRPPHRGRPCERQAQGCAAFAVLRPLRRAAARPAGTVENRALRAASATGRRDAGDRRARRLRRQGSAHDFPRGLPRLRGQWRAAVQCDLPVRGRGGDRLPVAAGISRRQQGRIVGAGAGPRLRHRHVERDHAGHHHHAARTGAGRGDPEGRQPRSAFRHVRRSRRQSDPCARENHRRASHGR